MNNILKIILILVFVLGIRSYVSATSNTAQFILVKSAYHVAGYSTLVPNDKNGNKKVILITIDDGPTKRAPEMMAILSKHKAKAIFFINGMHDKDAPGIIEQESKGGFTIGNHTWNHINLKREKNSDKIKREIDTTTELITKITGKRPQFFRPPYGEMNHYVKDLVKKDGMILMDWSGSALDWEKSTQDEKVFQKNVIDSMGPGGILLIHEHQWTVKYLDSMLSILEEKGYTFIDPGQITES